MRSRIFSSIAFLSVLPLLAGTPRAEGDDLAFLQPWFQASKKDRETLAKRGVVMRGLPASNKQLSVIGVCTVAISPDAFAERVPALFMRGELVMRRFSDPPGLDDLAGLSLDQLDLDRIRKCRPGACALNLSDHEMGALQRALAAPQSVAPAGIHEEFRRILLDRVRRYRSGGLAALPEYHDRPDPVRPAGIFSEILKQTPQLSAIVPDVATYLERFPSADNSREASSLHWSKVTMNNKPVIMVNHLTTFRLAPRSGIPSVLTVSRQVYASRYMNGELSLWMVFARTDGSGSYLVYVNRSQLDELGGALNAVKRSVIEGRVKDEAAQVLAALRQALERTR